MVESITVVEARTRGGRRVELLDLSDEYRQAPGVYRGWIHTAAGPIAASWGVDGSVWDRWTDAPNPSDPDNLELPL